MNNLMVETQRLMREWEIENPMWRGKITHANIKFEVILDFLMAEYERYRDGERLY